jgi:hypothetical protein
LPATCQAYDELGAKRWITALEMAKGINAGFQTIRREFTEDDEESEDGVRTVWSLGNRNGLPLAGTG